MNSKSTKKGLLPYVFLFGFILICLFLLNNYCEIKHVKNEVETTSSIYYDFTKNIYQYNYDSSK